LRISCIILARGGSKGVKNKNIIPFCGKPLIAHTILQAKASELITDVWVSSDSKKILEISKHYGAETIIRPAKLANDSSSSESAWKHALQQIDKKVGSVDFVVAPQVTSPIREPKDFNNAVKQLISSQKDSLLSVTEIDDYFCWALNGDGRPEAVNYDYHNRKRRQQLRKQFLENGSFYIFKPKILLDFNNRLGGEIELFVMEKVKGFQIDNYEDIRFCEVLMKGFKLNEATNE